MSHKGNEIYDVSPTEAEIMKFRAERRLLLRNQYLKEIHNPNSTVQGDLFDANQFRVYATHMLKENLFVPKPFRLFQTGLLLTAIYLTYKMVQNDRDARERKYRTGQVSYRDRDWKFC